MRFFAWSILVALLLLGNSHAWQSFEEASFNLHFKSYDTRHFWNKSGKLKPSHNHFKMWEIDLCVEVSPTPCDILAAYGRFDRIEETMDGNTTGFGDPELIWAHRLWHSDCSGVWSRMVMIIPFGKEKSSLRYGRFGFEGDLYYACSCKVFDYPIGTLAGLGYRWYQGYPSDQVRGYLDVTGHIISNVYWLGRAKLDYGVFNGRRKEDYNQILYNPNYRLLKLQFSIVGFLKSCIYVDAGYYQHVWGKNVGNGGGFIGGFGFIF